MSGDVSDQGGNNTGETTPDAGKTFTQEEVSKLLEGNRKQLQAENQELRVKADRLDKIEQANKSDMEKLQEAVSVAEQRADKAESQAMRATVQAAHGISDDDAALFLTASDEETLTAQAKRLADREVDRKKRGNVAPLEGGTAKTNNPGEDELSEFTRQLFGADD